MRHRKYRSNLRVLIARENLKRATLQQPSLTGYELSEKTGISRQTISRWMKDEPLFAGRITKQTTDAFCDFFKVSDMELLTLIEEDAPTVQIAG